MSPDGNGSRQALVVVNETVTGPEWRNGLMTQLDDGTEEVFVVSPAWPLHVMP